LPLFPVGTTFQLGRVSFGRGGRRRKRRRPWLYLPLVSQVFREKETEEFLRVLRLLFNASKTLSSKLHLG